MLYKRVFSLTDRQQGQEHHGIHCRMVLKVSGKLLQGGWNLNCLCPTCITADSLESSLPWILYCGHKTHCTFKALQDILLLQGTGTETRLLKSIPLYLRNLHSHQILKFLVFFIFFVCSFVCF